ncbi:hypothetical protein KSS87_010017 [Heliosperma pusillum]|nr:hypothetical protein KSS87_010017 [Heliosperma pusillum]
MEEILFYDDVDDDNCEESMFIDKRPRPRESVERASLIDRFVVARIEAHDESMITVGLELAKFVDPNLTWKTVSKGRNTSKRSRKPISRSLQLDQDLGKKQFQRLSGTHSLESDKSDVLVQRRGFGNMEHVPIKKRRFLFRSPSPPPQSPKHCEKSKEFDSGRGTLEQQTYANGITEKVVNGTDVSEPLCKNSVTHNNIENTASSFNGVPVSNEDFSGITMLAAAACGGGLESLDCTVGDVEKFKIGDLLKRDNNESFASATILKENIAISRSTDSLAEATGQLIEEGRVANLPIDSTEYVCLKSINEDGSSLINEPLKAKPNESVVSTISREESVELCGSSEALNNVVRCVEDIPSNSQNKDIEIADKTADTFVPRKYWDLNTIMDEWGQPVEDTSAGSCMQSVEVAPTNNMSSKKSWDVETSTPAERALAIESGERLDVQTVACAVSKALSDSGGFPAVVAAFDKSLNRLDVPSDLVASGLKGYCSLHGTNSHAIETTPSCVPESKSQWVVVAEADSDIDQKPKSLMNSKGQSSFRTELHEIDSSLVPLSENALCEVKAIDCGYTDSKEKNALDENDEEASITCQSVSTNFLGASNSNIAAMSASLSGNVLCKANDLGSGNSRPQEQMTFVDANVNKSLETASPLASTQSSRYEMPMVKWKVSDGAHCSSNMEALGTPLATINNCNTTPQASTRDYQMDAPNVTETSTSINSTGKAVEHLGSITPENHGDRNLPSLNEAFSELANNNANVASGRGYDCHLEDGEFRESVGHAYGWEDNEGEDNETEHVDYDSDDREGIIFEAPNDAVQLSGDALAGDCEKQSCGLDKSVDVDHSLQHQSCLSTVDAKVTDSFKRDSPLLKPCLGAPLKGVDRVEVDCKGASASADSIRSRSSNFDSMHHADCPSARHKPSVQTDLCCGPSQNVGLKSVVADSGPEEGRDRVYQPRNISASRSGYNSMRRGSSGERDNFHGTRMGNSRDTTLDSNSRSKFDRFSGGINRGFREGYHRRGAFNHIGEGRRSFSPRENRVDSHYPRSHRKSRSRSRTRSPDFRSEDRMGRARLPYQPPGHSANHIRGGRSSGRGFNQRPRFNNVGSPGRLRSNDGPMRFHDTNRDSDYEENNHYRRKPLFVRNDRRSRSRSRSYSPDYRPDTRVGSMRGSYQQTAGRGRRSPPVRVFRQFQRYDNGESPGERFNDNSQSSRGNDYDNGGNDFRRKPRNIFERIHPIRNQNEDGDSRRFPYDDQDDNNNNNNNNNQNFRRNENYGRGGGRRPMDFRREDRVNNNVRYDSDRMFDSGPKQFRVSNANPSQNLPSIYKTARIFTGGSITYVFNIEGKMGIHLNFTPESLMLREFILTVNSEKLDIVFTPVNVKSFGFVNAIEVISAPDSLFVNVGVPFVSPNGVNLGFVNLSSEILETVHRINVGGSKITPFNDTLWRTWIPDYDYLVLKSAALRVATPNPPVYRPGGATKEVAPDNVYMTAQEMNKKNVTAFAEFNISWSFPVVEKVQYFVRLHFCDIVSVALNQLYFDVYINGMMAKQDVDLSLLTAHTLASPYYMDFVVGMVDSGPIQISVGPSSLSSSSTKNAILNGVEIMKILNSKPKMREDSKGNRVLIVVCGVVGGFAILSVVAFAVFVAFKCRKKPTKPSESIGWTPVRGTGGSAYSRVTEASASPHGAGLKIPFEEVQFATNDFDRSLIIGSGGFGMVYKGVLRDGTTVAVKRAMPGSRQGLPEFHSEISVLSKIRHRHLVSMVGFCEEQSEMILAYEYMDKGPLKKHLYGGAVPPLSWKQRLDICIGSARGLHYLHTGFAQGIIHRDIKSTNILLDDSYVAKVADFGLSRSGPHIDQTHVSTDVKGSFGYLDPEYYRRQQLTDKSDVYSFGVVLLEVLCARPALDPLLAREQVNLAEWALEYQEAGRLEEIIDPKIKDEIKPPCLKIFGETAQKCLAEYGVDRPTMGDVLWNLEYALQLQEGQNRAAETDDSSNTITTETYTSTTAVPGDHANVIAIVDASDESINRSTSKVFSQLITSHGR